MFCSLAAMPAHLPAPTRQAAVALLAVTLILAGCGESASENEADAEAVGTAVAAVEM